ncbi:MAG: TonB-dependent receptor [Bacteroidetes bacterium]|nr:TonB-dependent receptor [Bacteroidota bacterium]
MNFKNVILFSFLTILTITNLLFASSSIRGVITDSTNGEPLYGANVYLLGTGYGSATNFKGEYIIHNIKSGDYVLRVNYIGYKTIENEIQINENSSLEVNFKLALIGVKGAEVVVVGQAVGQAAAINQQINSNTITNVVSSEKMLELPDANAAESVGRLPGISLIRSGGEGSKVVIRGLSATYNSISIGGVKIPSTDVSDRSVDLSMISSEILAGIEVTKALTPDKDADSFGGIVDFRLAKAKSGGFYSNSRIQSGFNQLRNDYGNYRASIIISNRYFEEKLGLLVTANTERTQRGNDRYNADWNLLREKRPGEEYAPLIPTGLGLRYEENDRKRYGFSALLDYSIPNGSIGLNSFISRKEDINNTQRTSYDYNGGSISRTFQNSQSSVAILSTALEGEHNYDAININWSLSLSSSETITPFSNSFSFSQNGAIDLSQLSNYPTADEVMNASTKDLTSSYFNKISRSSRSASEYTNSYKIDFKMPYSFFNSIFGSLKYGAKFSHNMRDRNSSSAFRNMYTFFSEKVEIYHPDYGKPGFVFQRVPGTGGRSSILNYIDTSFDPGNFVNGKYEYPVALSEYTLMYLLDNYILDSSLTFQRTASLDDYKVEENIASGYIMSEANISSFLTILAGVRYERTYAYLTGKRGIVPNDVVELDYSDNPVHDTSKTASYNNWFPMLQFKIKPSSWFDLRLSFTKSISRPHLEWMLPNVKIDGTTNTVEIGRPDIKPQISENYDAYLSFYGNEIGLLSFGGFYKDIKNLIYMRNGHKILNAGKEGFPTNWNGLILNSPENNPLKTKVYGMEFEWQSNLLWLPKPFNSLVININYSHIWSETSYPISFVNTEKIPVFPFLITSVIDTARNGKMPNQATDIANISLGYDIDKFSGRISLVYQGKSLAGIGEREEEDSFTSPVTRLDLSLKYQFSELFGVYFNMNNITNNADQSYKQIETYIDNTRYYGMTADFGIIFKL